MDSRKNGDSEPNDIGGKVAASGDPEKSASGNTWQGGETGGASQQSLAQSSSPTEKPKGSDGNTQPQVVHHRSWQVAWPSVPLLRSNHRPGRYERVPFVSVEAGPPPATLDDAKLLPLVNANWLSRLTFEWMGPLLQTGYARPLEPTDLWKIDESRSAGRYAQLIDDAFERRQKEAAEFNAKLDAGEIRPGLVKTIWWSIRGDKEKRESAWKQRSRKKASLLLALKYVANLKLVSSSLTL